METLSEVTKLHKLKTLVNFCRRGFIAVLHDSILRGPAPPSIAAVSIPTSSSELFMRDETNVFKGPIES